jgi:hypothetical protein
MALTPPPDGVDYIQAMVAEAVSDGLTALVKSQPADPIDFLGNFMLHYSKSLVSSKTVSLLLPSGRRRRQHHLEYCMIAAAAA